MPLQAEPLPLPAVFHPFPHLPPILSRSSSSPSSSSSMVLYMVSSSSFPASSSTFLAFLFQRSSSSPPLLLPRASLLSSAPLSFSTAPSSALPLPYPLSPPSPRPPSSSPSTGSSRANLLFHHCESPPVFADLPGPRHYKYPSSFCPWPLASIRVRPSIRLLSSQKEEGQGGRQEAPPFVASVARRNPFGQLDRIASASYVFFLLWNWKDIGQGEEEDALSLSLLLLSKRKSFKPFLSTETDAREEEWSSRKMFLEDWLDLPRTIARFDRGSVRVDHPNNASNVSILWRRMDCIG